MTGDVRTRGEWPGSLTLRRGWALARARPWNDQTTSTAALRLERGGSAFLRDCAGFLVGRGAEEVLSPALPEAQARVWRRAGFAPHLQLVVFERPLSEAFGPAAIPVTPVDDVDLAELALLDDRAFPPQWRVGALGLDDARTATVASQVLAVYADGIMLGFAIVGEMGGIAYLQRLTVDPEHAGRGIGRSLVREALTWARQRGARTILLNTQPDNLAASALYTSEGFIPAGPRLGVLRWSEAEGR